jgi:hypothetical protein
VTPCKGCGQRFRKGKRRAVLAEDGTVTIAIVCGECAARAFAVVRPIGGAANLCTVCKARPARQCSDCAAKARADLVVPILAQLAGLARAAELSGQKERADALEAAAHALAREADRGTTGEPS